MKDKNTKPTIKNKNFVPMEQLTDIPSRLFRRVTEVLNINTAKWKTYMDDYLRWTHPDDGSNTAEVKRARSTALGNIQNTLFCSKTLTWNKLLLGLKIARITEVEVSFKIKTESGEEHVITEKTLLRKLRNEIDED